MEMGGATSVRDACHQRRVQAVGWYHGLDGTLWLAASVVTRSLQVLTFLQSYPLNWRWGITPTLEKIVFAGTEYW